MGKRTEYQRLVKHLAGDRAVCNCGEAYYIKGGNRGCAHGCSSNQINTKYEIAAHLIKELGV